MSKDEGKDADYVHEDDEVSAPVAEPELVAVHVPRPAPTLPVDHLHVHRRLERLLGILEQQGVVVEDDLYNVRTTP